MMKKYNNRFPITVPGLTVSADRDFNKAMRIFNKKVQTDGLLKEIRDRSYYQSKSEKRQKQRKLARKRWLKKIEQMKIDGQLI